MIGFLVAADDRTGALETAVVCADAGWFVIVMIGDFGVFDLGLGCVVVDLVIWYVVIDVVAARVVWVEMVVVVCSVYKIDFILRGNWVVELVARW